MKNYCIDPAQLEKILSSHPKGTYQGVVAVSFAGYPVDTKRLREIADQYGIWILEDACHAPGAVTIEMMAAELHQVVANTPISVFFLFIRSSTSRQVRRNDHHPFQRTC